MSNWTSILREYNTSIKNPPTIIYETEDVSSTINSANLPASILVYLKASGECSSANGKNLGQIGEIFKQIAGKVLLNVYVKDETAANYFISFCKAENIEDICVVSDNTAILKAIREQLTYCRAAVDFRNLTQLTSLPEIIKTTNSNHAKIAIISAKQATRETVKYLQQRLITVWIYDDVDSPHNSHDLIQLGANGIVTKDFSKILQTLEWYKDEFTLVRHPFIIAHRGLPDKAPENTMESYKLGHDFGGEIIETDVQTTKDVKLVVMHDEYLGRTAVGEGRLYEKTLEELMQLTADNEGWKGTEFEGVKVPSLEQLLAYAKENGGFLFIELKEIHPQIVDEMLRVVEKHGMENDYCVISFYADTLADLHKKAPQISGGHLWLVVDDGVKNGNITLFDETVRHIKLAMESYATVNNAKTHCTAEYYEHLHHRGITAWPWTFGGEDGVPMALEQYHYNFGGMTLNNCEGLAKYPNGLETSKSKINAKVGQEVEFTAIASNRLREKLPADFEVVVIKGGEFIEIKGDKIFAKSTGVASIMLRHKYNFNGKTATIYTMPIEIKID